MKQKIFLIVFSFIFSTCYFTRSFKAPLNVNKLSDSLARILDNFSISIPFRYGIVISNNF